MTQSTLIDESKSWKYRFISVLILTFLLCTATYAQDAAASAVEEALAGLASALKDDEGLAPDTKEALKALVQALQAERAQRPAGGAAIAEADVAPAVDAYLATREAPRLERLLDRLDFSADMRLRYESSFNLDTARDRNRFRGRLRVGATYKIRDDLEFGTRIITGNFDDPQSPHHTFGTTFNSLRLSLDRIYLKYSPERANGLWITAGKFAHPFYANPVYGELVWDVDVQPEGIAIGYRIRDKGRLERFDIVVGEYIVLEQGGADDGYATVLQGATQVRLTDSLKAHIALGYYTYSDATPGGSTIILLRDNAGNKAIDRNLDGRLDDFVSDFGILNPIVALTYDGWKYPLTFSAEYIKNIRAKNEENKGWAVGAALGKTKVQGDWLAYYQWQVVEQDAVFSPVSQDDFLFGTNHRSHLFGGKYQLSDKIQLHLWGLVSQRERTFHFFTGGSDRSQWRARLDLNIKF